MTGDTITLSIELSPKALRKQSMMLSVMADVIETLPAHDNPLRIDKTIPKTAAEQLCSDLNKGIIADTLPPPPLAAKIVDTTVKVKTIDAQAPGLSGAVDSEGLPYDARIHSSSKAKNKTGAWKVARNMDAKLLAKVRAELIALRDAAKVSTPPAAIATPPAPPLLAETLAAKPPAPPAPPSPPAPVETSANDNAKNFTALLRHISGSVNGNQITSVQVNEILTARGIPQMGLLGKRPDLFDAIRVDIDNAILQNQIAAAQ